ncbi:MAG: FAD-dependent oxidoreductase [Campylobacterota bacterium]|nr:FAD-dependent oxidoreductase [Campylobacterota bacterium]
MSDFVEHYDVIIIGGGATSSGIALDASLRGLKCIVIEKNDFAQGTSSRSTKLVHGGVRYLEAAVKKLDLAQYALVKEGLKERYRILNNASHLARAITLVTPLYKWYEIPYMYVGLFLYDFISGKRRLGKSQIVSKKEIMDIFPGVKKAGLKGGVRYFDGAFNDARMVISLLQTAKQQGCEIRNYNEVINFTYENQKINGVTVHNHIKNEKYKLTAHHVINATGPFSDAIRKLDKEDVSNILEVSSGIHIVLDKKFLPNDEGLMIPKTQDGRVLFMLPYLGKCLVGTTDEKAKVEQNPKVEQKDIEYLLRHVRLYFDIEITQKDILSSWSGLRPLVVNTNLDAHNTKSIVREHYLDISASGLISIVGGKWTTYRKMAQDTVDFIALKNKKLMSCKCTTQDFKLVGSQKDISMVKNDLKKVYLNEETEDHLLRIYGDQATLVAQYINKYGFEKLHPNYSFLQAEVYYSIHNEFIYSSLDFLVRRINLGLIDAKAALSCVERVTRILSKEFNWDLETFNQEIQRSNNYLNSC